MNLAKGTNEMNEFTIQELSQYTGKDGMPAYIAYRGVVYDVTNSFLWRGGKHQVLHEAGRDLTKELEEAPHGEELFERVPSIGTLKD
jgi:predicted heme/steroid binding protein